MHDTLNNKLKVLELNKILDTKRAEVDAGRARASWIAVGEAGNVMRTLMVRLQFPLLQLGTHAVGSTVAKARLEELTLPIGQDSTAIKRQYNVALCGSRVLSAVYREYAAVLPPDIMPKHAAWSQLEPLDGLSEKDIVRDMLTLVENGIDNPVLPGRDTTYSLD